MSQELFPFAEYWWFYAGFTAFVLLLLSLDLGVFNRRDHTVTLREATIWTGVWISLALIFNVVLYQYTLVRFGPEPAREIGLEFLAGYLVEESLSVDNIFVFILLFRFFAIPAQFQHRVLFFGILGAIIFRAIFIALGSVLIQYQWVVIAFGVFLIFTGAKMFFARGESTDPRSNPVLGLIRRVIPVTDEFHGHSFFARVNGVLTATPLLVALLAIETSDIVFAIDSVPAVYGLTNEPLVVFTSNIFAILGLRSLYFVLADAIHRFHYLKHGVALVLVFVGIKMSLVHFSTGISLAVICTILAASVTISLFRSKQ